MAHNTFDTIKDVDGSFQLRSHNFPGHNGIGETFDEALQHLNRQIMYGFDNYPMVMQRFIEQRKRKGVVCLCGYCEN